MPYVPLENSLHMSHDSLSSQCGSQKDKRMPDRKYARTSLKTLLDQYWDELQKSQLADKSVEDYWYFAHCFVRWANGEFVPGGNVRESDG